MAEQDDQFQPVSGLPGKIYVPRPGGPRKHPCADCFSCQWCGDSRCNACRGGAGEWKDEDKGKSGQD